MWWYQWSLLKSINASFSTLMVFLFIHLICVGLKFRLSIYIFSIQFFFLVVTLFMLFSIYSPFRKMCNWIAINFTPKNKKSSKRETTKRMRKTSTRMIENEKKKRKAIFNLENREFFLVTKWNSWRFL